MKKIKHITALLCLLLMGCKNPYFQPLVHHSAIDVNETNLVLNLKKCKNPAELLSRIQFPEKVKVLILDSCELIDLPPLNAFINLKHLSLKYNPELRWSASFEKIAALKKLKFLNITGNYLQLLPHSIVQCQQINSLRLSHNNISPENIIATMAKMKNVKKLWIDHNKIEELPTAINGLENIRYLYAYNNNIKHLPQNLKPLKKLWEIHLANNKFDTLPEQLPTAKKLKMAYFGNNNITYIPTKYKRRRGMLFAITLANNPLPEQELKKAKRYFKNHWLIDL